MPSSSRATLRRGWNMLIVWLATGWLAAAGLTAAPAAASEPVPAEAFFRPPAVLEAQLSPSGRRLALTTESGGRVGLFVIDLQQAEVAFGRVAHFNDADVRRFAWVNEERLVFDVVDLKLGAGEDRRTAPGLFSARFDGTELRTLVERQGRAPISDGTPIRTLPWNHVLLHVPASQAAAGGADADEVIVGQMEFDRNELVDLRPIWLNTRTGRTRSLPLVGAPVRAVRWWFSPQGQPRAALAHRGSREALHWFHGPRDGQAGHWVQLTEGPLAGLPFRPAWVGRDDSLYVTHREGPAGERVVAPFDFQAGRPGATLVRVAGFDFMGELQGDDEGGRLLGVRVVSDAEETVWFDAAHQALQQAVDKALPGRVNRVSCRRCTAPDAVVLVKSWSDRHPGQWLLRLPADADGKPRWRLIANQQRGIDPARMARVDFERIRARDGRPLPLWLTRPTGALDGQSLPAVVLVHGGPWVRGGHWRWEPMAQFLASRGYLVIEPEFRGSAGYGAAHERAGDRQFGQAMQDDVSDALLWARQRGLASDKACIVGGSYGGYSTLMGLIRTPELYRCGSAWFAVADLLLYVEGGWFVEDDIGDSGRRHLLPLRVGDPVKDREMLLAHSPVAQAHRLRSPLQLVWGREDRRVPIAHGHRLRSAMQSAGLEPEWIEYEDEAHGLRRLVNRVDMARRLEAFLARHLK